MKKFFWPIALLVFPFAASAQTKPLPLTDCFQHATQAQLSGMASTNYQQGIIPLCTVTIYLTGTQTIATTTPQSPFTANSDGSIPPVTAAVNQGYDVTLSGGIPPNTYPAPVTFTDIFAGGGGGGGGISPPAFSIQVANSGATGPASDPNITINTQTHAIYSPTQALNVKAFGAQGTAKIIQNASIGAASTTLTGTGFTPAMSGQTVSIAMGPQGIWKANYQSSGTIAGFASQNCTITGFNGGGSGAQGVVYLNGTNTIAANAVIYMTTGTASAYGSGYTSAPTSATLGNGIALGSSTAATCSGTIAITGNLFSLPVTTTATYVSATQLTLANAATTSVPQANPSIGWAAIGANDTAAIQAAINCASGIAASCPGGIAVSTNAVYIPGGYYLVNGALTVPNNVMIIGDGATPLFGPVGNGSGGTRLPGTSNLVPQLASFVSGSVLVEVQPGSDVVDMQQAGNGVSIQGIGIVFAPAIAFLNTGHAFNATSSTLDFNSNPVYQTGSYWVNDVTWGGDGYHYAGNLTNTNNFNITAFQNFGGGGLNIGLQSPVCCNGNITVSGFISNVFAGGTASGINIPAGNNIIHFERPQSQMYGVTVTATNPYLELWPIPPANKNGNLQGSFNAAPTVTDVSITNPDFENGYVSFEDPSVGYDPSFTCIGRCGNLGSSIGSEWYVGNHPVDFFGYQSPMMTIRNITALNNGPLLSLEEPVIDSRNDSFGLTIGRDNSTNQAYGRMFFNWLGSASVANYLSLTANVFDAQHANTLGIWAGTEVCIYCDPANGEPAISEFTVNGGGAAHHPTVGYFTNSAGALSNVAQLAVFSSANNAADNLAATFLESSLPGPTNAEVVVIGTGTGATPISGEALSVAYLGTGATPYGRLGLWNSTTAANTLTLWGNGVGINNGTTPVTSGLAVGGPIASTGLISTTGALSAGTTINATGTITGNVVESITNFNVNGTNGVSKTCTVLPTVVGGIVTSC